MDSLACIYLFHLGTVFRCCGVLECFFPILCFGRYAEAAGDYFSLMIAKHIFLSNGVAVKELILPRFVAHYYWCIVFFFSPFYLFGSSGKIVG